MSLKALSKQHLQRNQQRNYDATASCAGGNHSATISCAGEVPDAAATWRAFYLEADRLYRQHRPCPEQMAQHHHHRRNADILIDLGLFDKAATELKMALDAMTTNSATSAKELNQ